MTKKKEINPKR